MSQKNHPNPFPLALSSLALSFLPASGAIVSLTGGVEGGTALQNQDRYVVDLGFLVPTLPAAPNRALFEGGGDGDGTSIALVGNTIRVFLDTQLAGASDTTFNVDIASFAGQVVTIRLQGDYTGTTAGSDTARLDIFNGASTLTSGTVTLVSDISSAAGLDGFGTGGRGSNSWPGAGEDPNMGQFNTSAYDIGDGGANVLGGDVLLGTLFTGAADSDDALTAGMPAPSGWGIIPEPSSGVLALLGAGLLAGQRRRQG